MPTLTPSEAMIKCLSYLTVDEQREAMQHLQLKAYISALAVLSRSLYTGCPKRFFAIACRSNPALSMYYMREHADGKRLKRFEDVIVADAFASRMYAQHVLEGRWRRAEPVIKTDLRQWARYKRFFNIEQGEDRLFKL